MADKIMIPKESHVLILRIFEYATLHGKRDFADVIKIKDLDIGWIVGGPNLITFLKGRRDRRIGQKDEV